MTNTETNNTAPQKPKTSVGKRLLFVFGAVAGLAIAHAIINTTKNAAGDVIVIEGDVYVDNVPVEDPTD